MTDTSTFCRIGFHLGILSVLAASPILNIYVTRPATLLNLLFYIYSARFSYALSYHVSAGRSSYIPGAIKFVSNCHLGRCKSSLRANLAWELAVLIAATGKHPWACVMTYYYVLYNSTVRVWLEIVQIWHRIQIRYRFLHPGSPLPTCFLSHPNIRNLIYRVASGV